VLIAMPIMSCATARNAKLATIPQSPEFRVVTIPIPVSRALAMARSMARAEITWPEPPLPSTTAVPGLSSRIIEGGDRSARCLRRTTRPCSPQAKALRLVRAQVGVKQTVGEESCLLVVGAVRAGEVVVKCVEGGRGDAHDPLRSGTRRRGQSGARGVRKNHD
jgi:hypothetical protein